MKKALERHVKPVVAKVPLADCCPFCGYWPGRVSLGPPDDGKRYFTQCTVCGARGPWADTQLLAVPM